MKSLWENTDCPHVKLQYEPSPYAREVGYEQPSAKERAAAYRLKGSDSHVKEDDIEIDPVSPGTFPAPLVLPGDELALDPQYPPQDVTTWQNDRDRNQVTEDRRTIYVAAPPGVNDDVYFVKEWIYPDQYCGGIPSAKPDADMIVDYLAAFYHGMPVKLLDTPKLTFTRWNKEAKAKSLSVTPRYIGLRADNECTRIRTRKGKDEVYLRQLNLDDLLDAAISILPKDAYALLLLVHHDLYESTEDVFTCGRAYGGSRIAIVSTARYYPSLDGLHDYWVHEMPLHHTWPASHCEAYIQQRCSHAMALQPLRKKKTGGKASVYSASDASKAEGPTPMQAALDAYTPLPGLAHVPHAWHVTGLYFARACLTASHELGHCFGIDHCVYYACCMQGSATLAEDARQPPYLCPVDLKKLLLATGADEEQRYRALLHFCENVDPRKEWHMFTAYAAWIRGRLEELGKKGPTMLVKEEAS